MKKVVVLFLILLIRSFHRYAVVGNNGVGKTTLLNTDPTLAYAQGHMVILVGAAVLIE